MRRRELFWTRRFFLRAWRRSLQLPSISLTPACLHFLTLLPGHPPFTTLRRNAASLPPLDLRHACQRTACTAGTSRCRTHHSRHLPRLSVDADWRATTSTRISAAPSSLPSLPPRDAAAHTPRWHCATAHCHAHSAATASCHLHRHMSCRSRGTRGSAYISWRCGRCETLFCTLRLTAAWTPATGLPHCL